MEEPWEDWRSWWLPLGGCSRRLAPVRRARKQKWSNSHQKNGIFRLCLELRWNDGNPGTSLHRRGFKPTTWPQPPTPPPRHPAPPRHSQAAWTQPQPGGRHLHLRCGTQLSAAARPPLRLRGNHTRKKKNERKKRMMEKKDRDWHQKKKKKNAGETACRLECRHESCWRLV